MRRNYQEEIFLDYSGPISFQIKKELISILRKKVDCYAGELNTKRRCSYIFEELLANANEYYKKRNLTSEPVRVMLILADKSDIVLSITNTLLKSDTTDVLDNFNALNTGQEEELRQLFRSNLKGNGKKGTGNSLGLITVKLKTGYTYIIELTEKNEAQNIFQLKTTIDLNL
jgi:hypothetical protein